MTCADFDILLCDYVDGSLDSLRKGQVEQHLSECASCAELARDSSSAVAFMERVEVVAPPPELLTRILFELRGTKPESRTKLSWFRRIFGSVLDPILQPRFVMGMAMTILSFSMLGRFAGIPVRQLKASDLEPGKIWTSMEHKVNRGWLSIVKYYESLRFVYEVQSRVREWSEQEDEQNTAKDPGAGSGAQKPAEGSVSPNPRLIHPDDRRLRDYGQTPAPSSDGSGSRGIERPKQ
jgi:hypothetical protein